ncbi:MAG TPA: ABC transporter transmembrane domain-containing protein [Armatimonadota bacterium]|jgi:ATP-binding cassette subfamily B protein
MPLQENLPESMEPLLPTDARDADGKLKVTVAADLDEDGRYAERWLAVTDDRVMVMEGVDADGNASKVALDVPLDSITGVKTQSLVGSGVLEATVDGQPVEIVRYSNAMVGKFNRVAAVLNAEVKGEDPPEASDHQERARCPKCHRILPEFTNVCPACLDRKQVIKRLASYFAPYRWQTLAICLLMLAGTAVDLVPGVLNRTLVDRILVPGALAHEAGRPVASFTHLLGLVVLLYVVTRIASLAVSVARGRTVAYLGGRITYDIRTQLYRALQRLSLSFYDKRQTGSILARVTNDTRELQGALIDGLQFFLVNILIVGAIVGVLLFMNWRLALLVLIPTPIVIFCSLVFWRRIWAMFRRYFHANSRMTGTLADVLNGIRVVKAFAQEEREVERFDQRVGAVYEAIVRAETTWATYFPFLTFLATAGSFIVWYFGGLQVVSGAITLGTFTAFLFYVAMFFGPLQFISRITDWLSRALTATERVFEILDTQPEVADRKDAVRMPHIKGDVTLDDIVFGYDKNKPVLKGVSMEVKAGEMIGLCGHSGAGKSTIINLINRFYDVDAGRILVDGVDLRKIRLKDLSEQIGIVLQEPFLFTGSIYENIAYAKPTATREEVMRAAKAANAHDFILKFPDGYDTRVGERGQTLSGGERQRISIARAILHNPRILILDEATSSVDTETEKQIQEAIQRLVKNRTTFAIAHRLSTLREADRLLVLKEGKVAEIGTHEELLANPDGEFRKLVDMQNEINQLVTATVGG